MCGALGDCKVNSVLTPTSHYLHIASLRSFFALNFHGMRINDVVEYFF